MGAAPPNVTRGHIQTKHYAAIALNEDSVFFTEQSELLVNGAITFNICEQEP